MGHIRNGQGLVMDFEHQGMLMYILSPTVIGFFEFAFMRVRTDLPQKEIAGHMVAYAHDEPDFARAVFAGKVQAGRALVHEGAADPADLTRIVVALPPVKKALLSEQVQSRFFRALAER